MKYRPSIQILTNDHRNLGKFTCSSKYRGKVSKKCPIHNRLPSKQIQLSVTFITLFRSSLLTARGYLEAELPLLRHWRNQKEAQRGLPERIETHSHLYHNYIRSAMLLILKQKTYSIPVTTAFHASWYAGQLAGGVGSVSEGEPLSRIAARNRSWCAPLYAVICIPTDVAPADWPKIVTCFGSPPNAAILSWTHCNARRWSSSPRFRALLAIASLPAGDVSFQSGFQGKYLPENPKKLSL
jgi:hypothetical protein